jgi:hypothetical protein
MKGTKGQSQLKNIVSGVNPSLDQLKQIDLANSTALVF